VQWLLLFFEKSKQKLSPASDAMKDSALAISSFPHQPRANKRLLKFVLWLDIIINKKIKYRTPINLDSKDRN
jgi:hypothetical protein